MNKKPELLGSSGDSLREACGKALKKIAHDYPNVIVLDADIAGGTGMHHFRDAFPERFVQCGIAEQNMMAMAGGLAATGLTPLVTTFAIFMLRAIEQARLSIAYANMNVKIIASHQGLDVGPDGASAQCLEDIACFRAIPNMTVLSPSDPLEMEQATKAMLDIEGPVYIRTGRSESKRFLKNDYKFKIGKAEIIKDGSDITIIGCGVTTYRCLKAAKALEAQGISVRVVNMSTIKPIDKDCIIKCSNDTKGIISVEDHNIIGGLGSAISEVLSSNNPSPMEFVGVHDEFGESGEPDELAEKYGVDSSAIILAAKKLLARV